MCLSGMCFPRLVSYLLEGKDVGVGCILESGLSFPTKLWVALPGFNGEVNWGTVSKHLSCAQSCPNSPGPSPVSRGGGEALAAAPQAVHFPGLPMLQQAGPACWAHALGAAAASRCRAAGAH